MNKTVMRYVNLADILVYRMVSGKVLKRFPDDQSLIDAKLMLPNEVNKLNAIDNKNKNLTVGEEVSWVPLMWATKVITK